MAEMHSSIKQWNERVDALNAAQKDEMKIASVQTLKSLLERADKMEKTIEALRGRIERLETEGGV
jgi:tRNA C32,U32 (ribose-2'-O)-methylase TrmJ